MRSPPFFSSSARPLFLFFPLPVRPLSCLGLRPSFFSFFPPSSPFLARFLRSSVVAVVLSVCPSFLFSLGVRCGCFFSLFRRFRRRSFRWAARLRRGLACASRVRPGACFFVRSLACLAGLSGRLRWGSRGGSGGFFWGAFRRWLGFVGAPRFPRPAPPCVPRSGGSFPVASFPGSLGRWLFSARPFLLRWAGFSLPFAVRVAWASLRPFGGRGGPGGGCRRLCGRLRFRFFVGFPLRWLGGLGSLLSPFGLRARSVAVRLRGFCCRRAFFGVALRRFCAVAPVFGLSLGLSPAWLFFVAGLFLSLGLGRFGVRASGVTVTVSPGPLRPSSPLHPDRAFPFLRLSCHRRPRG